MDSVWARRLATASSWSSMARRRAAWRRRAAARRSSVTSVAFGRGFVGSSTAPHPSHPERTGVRRIASHLMADENLAEKPKVFVPPGEAPPDSLVIEDLVEGDGPVA